MRRAVVMLGLLATIGCQGEEPPPAELPRAGMKPILRMGTVNTRAGAAPTVEQGAIRAALETNNANFNDRYNKLTPEAAPSEFVRTFTEYVKEMRALDVKDTSLEFRGAWNRYLAAWDTFLAEVKITPDGLYKEVEFMEAIHGAFGVGGSDSVRAIGTDAVKAAEKLKDALTKLQGTAEVVGVATQ